MKREQFNFISTVQPVIPVVEVPIDEDPNKPIFDEIFKLDPHTGLPSNAQQVFLSEDTNPMIKDFIARVLKGSDMPKDSTFKDLSDDVISELTINHGESRVHYLERVQNYLETQKQSIRDSFAKKSEEVISE